MMNILHTIDTTGPGGAETVFINLLKLLDKSRFKSYAAIRGKGWVCDQVRANGYDPIFIDAKGSFNLDYLKQLIRLIRKYKIDVIQSHLFGSNVYCSMAGFICRIPVISTMHGFVDAEKNDKLLKLKFMLINAGSNKIVFVSDHLKKYFFENTNVSKKKSITIYNGIDNSVFRPITDNGFKKELGLEPGATLIGSLGNIRKSKGYDCLLDAASLVVNKKPDCMFLIVGEGSGKLYESLLLKRKNLNLENNVKFMGFREDTPRIINSFDVFVLPSITEGLSISTLEAMACRRPVIATRSGGPEEIIQDDFNGILADPGNAEMLSNSILKLIVNVELCDRLATNGYYSVINKFSMDNCITQYMELYR